MKRESLLTKTLKQFAYCIGICFVLTTPLFYLLTKNFYAEDMIDIIESVKQGEGIPPLDLEQDIIAGMTLQFMLIFVVVSLALYVTLRFVTKKIWQPFDDTLHKAEQFNLAKGDMPSFIDTDIHEFYRLNNSLKTLMTKDKETYRIQKEFTENASHELQTPLAIIRSKLDLLMQEKLNEKQMKIISELYDLTIRMGNLNRNLLLLAKIENAQYAQMEDVDVVSMLSKTLPMYSTLQNGTELKLIDSRNNHNATIVANPILFECLTKNLIVNAIRHSAVNSEIKIIVEDNTFIVSNVSIEKTPLDEETMFQRFHTDKMQAKGNGLGLAIVKAVCNFHHWKIDYKFENGHHKFIVTFCQRH